MSRVRLLFVVALLATGCAASRASVVTVRIPHPSRAEVLPAATQIAAGYLRDDRWFGVPSGTLVDRAALTRADDERVCVQLALWAARQEPMRNDFRTYTFELEARDEAGVALTRASPELRAVAQWETSAVSQTWVRIGYALLQQEVVKPIGHAASDVCVDNDGFLTERTRSLTLILRREGRVRRFTWELDPNGSYSQQAIAAGPSFELRPESGPPAVASAPAAQANAGGLEALPYPMQQVPGGHPPDIAQMRALLDARFGALRQCLSRAMEADPRLLGREGQIISEFTLGPSGVANVRITRNDFSPAVASCLTEHLRTLPVPPDPLRWTAMFRYGVVNRIERRPM